MGGGRGRSFFAGRGKRTPRKPEYSLFLWEENEGGAVPTLNSKEEGERGGKKTRESFISQAENAKGEKGNLEEEGKSG